MPYVLKGYHFAVVVRNVEVDYEKEIVQTLLLIPLSEYAYIYHRKEDSDSKTNHYHIYIHTKEQKTLKFISDIFGVNVVDVELLNVPRKFIRYLIHCDSPDKYQYEVFDIKTNIENIEEICRKDLSVKEFEHSDLKLLTEFILDNDISSFREAVFAVLQAYPQKLVVLSKYSFYFKQIIY